MLSAITGYFMRQFTYLEKANAEATWDEALDLAIYKISQLRDIESENGKQELGLILDELKLAQLENTAEQSNMIVIFDLPWENVPGIT